MKDFFDLLEDLQKAESDMMRASIAWNTMHAAYDEGFKAAMEETLASGPVMVRTPSDDLINEIRPRGLGTRAFYDAIRAVLLKDQA